MKKLIVIILFFSSFEAIQAQALQMSERPIVTNGPVVKVKKSRLLDRIIGKDESGYYLLQVKYGILGAPSQYLAHADNNLMKTKSVNLPKKSADQKLDYHGIFLFENRLLLFSKYDDRSLKTRNLLMQEIDKKTLLPLDEGRKIAELNLRETNNKYFATFGIRTSPDGSKILIYSKKPRQLNKPEEFEVNVFDSEFNLLWNQKYSLPYENDYFRLLKFLVNDTGKVFMLGAYCDVPEGSIVVGVSEKQDKKKVCSYMVYAFSEDVKGHEEVTLVVDDMVIRDAFIEFSDNQDIICAGLTAEIGSTDDSGIFFHCLDGENMSVICRDTKELPNKRDGNSRFSPDFKVRKISIFSDGSIGFAAESYWSGKQFESWGDGQRSVMKYEHGNILVSRFSREGKIEWLKNFSKSVTQNPVLIMEDESMLHILSVNESGLKESHSKRLDMNSIDPQGDVKWTRLIDGKKKDLTINIKRCSRIDEKELLLIGRSKKREGLISVVIP